MAQPASEVGNAETALLGALPAQIATLDRRGAPEVDRTPGVVSGAIEQYGQPGVVATVHLFNRDTVPVADGPDSPAARAELEAATTVAAAALHQALNAPKFGTTAQLELRSAAGAAAMRCRVLLLPLATHSVTDATCVTGLRERLLKVRITLNHPHDESAIAALAAGGFAGAVMSILRGEAPPAPGLSGILRT